MTSEENPKSLSKNLDLTLSLHDVAGNLSKRHLWPGSEQNCAYDQLNRPTMVESVAPGWTFARTWYQYDNVSREAATWRDEQGAGDQFHYEVTSQLSTVSYNAQNVLNNDTPSGGNRNVGYTYTADKLNRSSVTENGATTNYSNVSQVNQYGTVGSQSLSYNASLNLQSYAGWSYTYDAENRLTAVSGNGHSMSAVYDGTGRCLQRTIDGVTTTYVYDEWSAVNEFSSSGETVWNLFGPGGADDLQMRVSSVWGTQFYYKDREGNVSFITDTSTNILEQYRYDAFGKPIITGWADWLGANQRATSSIGNRYMFTGREYFSSFGIYDYRHRVYQPDLGRFLQLDPKGFDAGDMNLFRYCDDDPVDRTDPTGLSGTPIAADLLRRDKADWEWFNGGVVLAMLQEQRQSQPAGNDGAKNPLDVRYENYPAGGSGGRPVVERALKVLKGTAKGQEEYSKHDIVTIRPTDARHHTGYGQDPATGRKFLFLNPKDSRFYDAATYRAVPAAERPPESDQGRAVVIGHEFGHAVLGAHDESARFPNGRNIRDNENAIRAQVVPSIPPRRSYGGTHFPIDE